MFSRFAYEQTPNSDRVVEEMATFDAIDEAVTRFNGLSTPEQNELFTRDAFARFSNEVKLVYQWNCAMMDKGRDAFSVPAMLVPAILGMEYESRFNQATFIKNFLEAHGHRGVDWEIFAKNEMKFVVENDFNDFNNEFKAPNAVDKIIRFSRDDHFNTKYPMVTPHFARVLMMRSTSRLGRELADFFTVVHDELRAYLQGKESALAPVIQSVVEAPTASILVVPEWAVGKNKRMTKAGERYFTMRSEEAKYGQESEKTKRMELEVGTKRMELEEGTKRTELEEGTKRMELEEETKRVQEETKRMELEEGTKRFELETKRMELELETKRFELEQETKRILSQEETKRIELEIRITSQNNLMSDHIQTLERGRLIPLAQRARKGTPASRFFENSMKK